MSVERIEDDENAALWAEEAERRDADLDGDPGGACRSEEVFRNAKRALKK